MAIRKDGKDTQEKLLQAASEVFATKGYRDTTVAEISRRAGCNLAAVNYHFGGKDALYVEVWKSAFAESIRVYPPDGGLPAEASAEDKLAALIRSHVHRILDGGKLGHAGKILFQEVTHPTDAITQVWHDAILPARQRVQSIMAKLLGPGAEQEDIVFCEMSVINQCMGIGIRKRRFPKDTFEKEFALDRMEELARHIFRFSLAGIQAVRQDIARRNE